MINKGPLLILLGSVCFSFSGTFQQFAPSGATPFTITEARMLIGAAGLLFWCLLSRKFSVSFGSMRWKYLVLMAVSLLSFQLLFFSSVLKTGVAVGTVVAIGSTPIWTAIIEKTVFNKSPRSVWFIATTIAVVGIILLNLQNFSGQVNILYTFLPLLAGLAYALEIVFAKEAMQGSSSEVCMMIVMALVALFNLPSLFFNELTWAFTSRGILVCLGLGLVTASMAFALFFGGTKTTPAAVASTLGMAEPLGAALWGITLLHEPCSLTTLSGIVLILLSLILLIKPEKQTAYSTQ